MTLSTATTTPTRAAGPSLAKLVSGVPEERRLRHPADALVIIGRQLELIVQDDSLAADLVIGTLRFSLFRLHQGRIAQMAPFCRSITVYGEADIPAPEMPGVEFVALPPGSPMSQEWFLIVDSPGFWGALITQAVPDRSGGAARRYLFEGALSGDERVVGRANLLLSLTRRQASAEIGERDTLANRARWARVAYNLASHSEAERLSLSASLVDLPEMADVLAIRSLELAHFLPEAVHTLRRHAGAAAEVLYRFDGQALRPVVWSGPQPPASLAPGEGLAGHALQSGAPALATLAPGEAERSGLLQAQSAIAVPLSIGGQPWGVLVAGHAEPDPQESPTALGTIGVAALIQQILADRADEAFRFGAPPTAAPAAPAAPAVNGDFDLASLGFDLGADLVGAPAVQTPARTQPAAPIQPAAQPLTPAQPAAPAARPAMPAPAAPPAPAGFNLPAWMRGGGAPGAAPGAAPAAPAAPIAAPDRSWAALQKRLMGALVAFDERSAHAVWNEACSIYPTEQICTELLIPVQIAVGEGWHRGEVSVAAEHYCSRFVQGKLLNLLNAHIDNTSGPLAVIGCAQGELHEIGAIMLSLFMRWAGFRVIYLGQNVPNSTIEETMRQLRPQVLGLSATTIEGAHALTEVGQIITRLEPPRPLFIFGGMAFYERPDLRSRIHGKFLEGDVRQIVKDLAETLRRG